MVACCNIAACCIAYFPPYGDGTANGTEDAGAVPADDVAEDAIGGVEDEDDGCFNSDDVDVEDADADADGDVNDGFNSDDDDEDEDEDEDDEDADEDEDDG